MNGNDYDDYWDNSGEQANDYPTGDYETEYEGGYDSDSYEPYYQEDAHYYEDNEPEVGAPFSLSSLFSKGPGPGTIVAAMIAMCLLLAIVLLSSTGSLTEAIYAAGQAAQGADTQVAAAPAAQQDAATISADCAVSDLFPKKVLRWCELITQYASKHELSPDLIAALIWLESGGNEVAYSRSGAVGLMQVMPSDGIAATFSCVNGPCFADRPTTAQLQDPEFNIAFGTRMLAGLIRKNGGLREALKSYGPMDVGYSYADKVINLFQQHTK